MEGENPQEAEIRLRFGGGINKAGSEDAIKDTEAVFGQNFDIEREGLAFRRRKPFDLKATATNGAQIHGFAQYEDADGTLSTLIQAGTAVYEWDGASTFTSRGTVSASARLRGPLSANMVTQGEVLITDLALQENVKTWDGTTFADLSHNLGSGVNFKAKYCVVDNERALFANCNDGTSLPHLLVGSERDNPNNLTVTNRPASSLNEQDPFFLPMPDLRPINGIVAAFSTVAISTTQGTWKLDGASAKDYAMNPLHPGSGADGDEGLIYIGNDIAIARQGAIDTVFATERFGDVATDDLSRWVHPLVIDSGDWKATFNSRTQKAFFNPADESLLWVLHKPVLDRTTRQVLRRETADDVSPWARWKTAHDMGFSTNVMWTMKDPQTGLLQTYMGGPNGEIFQLDGDGSQDGGTSDVASERTSRLFPAPKLENFNIEGYVSYRRRSNETLNLTVQWNGETVEDVEISVALDGTDDQPVYSGGAYYSGSSYYTAKFSDRRVRDNFSVSGQASDFRIKTRVEGSQDFFIEEVVLRFVAI